MFILVLYYDYHKISVNEAIYHNYFQKECKGIEKLKEINATPWTK